jgi:hypothetical protein
MRSFFIIRLLEELENKNAIQLKKLLLANQLISGVEESLVIS